MRWILESTDQAEVLAKALGLTAPAARVLAARGFWDPEDARRFLHPTLADLNDPDLLRSMPEAVARVRQATLRKYSSGVRPFTVNLPEPRRMYTRATDSLRRPVP